MASARVECVNEETGKWVTWISHLLFLRHKSRVCLPTLRKFVINLSQEQKSRVLKPGILDCEPAALTATPLFPVSNNSPSFISCVCSLRYPACIAHAPCSLPASAMFLHIIS
jgi:hypothetical protein